MHYYAPRQALIDSARQHLLGDDPAKGGHYITVWAPRQSGKSWIIIEAYRMLRRDSRFDTVILPLQTLNIETDINRVAHILARDVAKILKLEPPTVDGLDDLYGFFEQGNLSKPLILILDEFDALEESVLVALVGFFRNIYHHNLF